MVVEGVYEDPEAFLGTSPNFSFKRYNFPFPKRGISLFQFDSLQLSLKDFWLQIRQKKEKGKKRK